MSNFRPTDRLTGFLMPPSVDEWLPQRHLARFVVEVVDGLDLSGMSASYRGTGSASYIRPRCWAFWFMATPLACSPAVNWSGRLMIRWRSASSAGNDHPDHDTIATFRRRFLKEIESLFVKVLLLAREMGVLKMGTVALDGTKIHANASRHSALSYEHAGKIEAQLKAEVADLLAKAEAADQTDIPGGISIPEELARREDRLEKLAERVPRSRPVPKNGLREGWQTTRRSWRRGKRRPRPRAKSPAANRPSLRWKARCPPIRSI